MNYSGIVIDMAQMILEQHIQLHSGSPDKCHTALCRDAAKVMERRP